MGGKGNEGVAGQIRQLQGSIGYVELIYAVQNKITYGSVRNAAGNFVKATLDGVTEAAASVAKQCPPIFAFPLPMRPARRRTPSRSFTWLLIPVQAKDPKKGKIIADFLDWMVNDGQKMTSQLSYAPLPANVVEKVKAAIKQIH